MNMIKRMLIEHSSRAHEIGHAIIRIGVGIILVIFGFSKFMSGSENLVKLGSAMALFGITGGYLFWGYMVVVTEFFAGFAYIFGFCTRLVSVPLLWLLFVAMRFHINKGDQFTVWAFACTLFIIALGLLIAGSGKYSVDYFLTKNETKNRYEL